MFANKKKDILENGIQACAVITGVSDTGASVNDNPRVELTLQVRRDGEVPFEVKKKTLVSRVSIPRPGNTIWVRYDPADPSRVELDNVKTREVNAAQTELALAPAGVTTNLEGVQVIDARNIPGLRDQLLNAVGDGAGASPASSDPLERLKKLNDLRLAGALSEAEFESQKAKILGQG